MWNHCLEGWLNSGVGKSTGVQVSPQGPASGCGAKSKVRPGSHTRLARYTRGGQSVDWVKVIVLPGKYNVGRERSKGVDYISVSGVRRDHRIQVGKEGSEDLQLVVGERETAETCGINQLWSSVRVKNPRREQRTEQEGGIVTVEWDAWNRSYGGSTIVGNDKVKGRAMVWGATIP